MSSIMGVQAAGLTAVAGGRRDARHEPGSVVPGWSGPSTGRAAGPGRRSARRRAVRARRHAGPMAAAGRGLCPPRRSRSRRRCGSPVVDEPVHVEHWAAARAFHQAAPWSRSAAASRYSPPRSTPSTQPRQVVAGLAGCRQPRPLLLAGSSALVASSPSSTASWAARPRLSSRPAVLRPRASSSSSRRPAAAASTCSAGQRQRARHVDHDPADLDSAAGQPAQLGDAVQGLLHRHLLQQHVTKCTAVSGDRMTRWTVSAWPRIGPTRAQPGDLGGDIEEPADAASGRGRP